MSNIKKSNDLVDEVLNECDEYLSEGREYRWKYLTCDVTGYCVWESEPDFSDGKFCSNGCCRAVSVAEIECPLDDIKMNSLYRIDLYKDNGDLSIESISLIESFDTFSSDQCSEDKEPQDDEPKWIYLTLDNYGYCLWPECPLWSPRSGYFYGDLSTTFTKLESYEINVPYLLKWGGLYRVISYTHEVDFNVTELELVEQFELGCDQRLENKEPQDDPDVLLKSEMIDTSHTYEAGESVAKVAADFMGNIPVEKSHYWLTYDRLGLTIWEGKPVWNIKDMVFYYPEGDQSFDYRQLNDYAYPLPELREIELLDDITFDNFDCGSGRSYKMISVWCPTDSGGADYIDDGYDCDTFSSDQYSENKESLEALRLAVEKLENESMEEMTTNLTTSSDELNNRHVHPDYYNWMPDIKGVHIECQDIAQHFNYNLGQVCKYMWRAGHKTELGVSNKAKKLEDLKKIEQYIKFEIERVNTYE